MSAIVPSIVPPLVLDFAEVTETRVTSEVKKTRDAAGIRAAKAAADA